MIAHFIHHVPFEGPGRIRDWALQAGYTCSTTWQHEGTPLPDPASVDLAVITGGPMSIHDEMEFPWLVEEKKWISELLKRETPVLGICLGAQLIADVMGATVAPMGHKEIGWFPLTSTPEASTVPFASTLQDGLHVLHWHGDQFDIPSGGIRLWQSERCPHQGFTAGSALGLQFHLELDSETLGNLIDHARNELEPDTDGIQSEEDLRSDCQYAQDTHPALFTLLDGWLTHLTA